MIKTQREILKLIKCNHAKAENHFSIIRDNIKQLSRSIGMESDYPIVALIMKEQLENISNRVGHIHDMITDSTVEKVASLQAELEIAMKHLKGLSEVVDSAY